MTYTLLSCQLYHAIPSYTYWKNPWKIAPQTYLSCVSTAASRTHWETRDKGPAVAAPENLRPVVFNSVNLKPCKLSKSPPLLPLIFDDSLYSRVVCHASCYHSFCLLPSCYHVHYIFDQFFSTNKKHILVPLTPPASWGEPV